MIENLKDRDGVVKILKKFRDAGYEAYLVGGTVRDIILEKSPKDIDITTNARPEKVKEIFHKTVDTGLKHGTVTVMEEGLTVEVTTYRVEGKYSDSRRPDQITYVDTIDEDLTRRDFTMNAIAYDPLRNEIVDNHNGIIDIKNKLIRSVGNATDRFNEDALRPFRAFRFASTLNFDIDTEIFEAISNEDVREKAKYVSKERYVGELLKGFSEGSHTEKMLDCIYRTDYFKLFAKSNVPCELDIIATHKDSSLILKLSIFLFDFYIQNGSFKTGDWLKFLKFPNTIVEDVVWVCRYIEFIISNEKRTDFDIRLFLSNLKKDSKTYLLDIFKGYESYDFMIKYMKDPIVTSDLEVNGNDMKELGLTGSDIGKVLNGLLVEVLKDPEKNDRETLLKMVEKIS